MAQFHKKRVAVIDCAGGMRTGDSVPDHPDCRAAQEAGQAGFLSCKWGCLGLGSCVKACRLQAVHIGASGVAIIDREKCVGCGLCVKACPRSLIRLVSPEQSILSRCSGQDSGAETRKVCNNGCIACGICMKNCPVDAISMENNHAVIDKDRCIECGMCAVKCPRGTIIDTDGIFSAII